MYVRTDFKRTIELTTVQIYVRLRVRVSIRFVRLCRYCEVKYIYVDHAYAYTNVLRIYLMCNYVHAAIHK